MKELFVSNLFDPDLCLFGLFTSFGLNLFHLLHAGLDFLSFLEFVNFDFFLLLMLFSFVLLLHLFLHLLQMSAVELLVLLVELEHFFHELLVLLTGNWRWRLRKHR